jgi:hypothetical protein
MIAVERLVPRIAPPVMAVGMGVVGGVAGATGRVDVIAIVAALVAALAVASSRRALLYFIVVGGIVLTGLAQLYFPGLRNIRLVVPLAAAVLLFHGAMNQLDRQDAPAQSIPNHIVFWMLAFVAISVLSTLESFTTAFAALDAFQGYFQAWVFLFALALVRWGPQQLDRLPKLLLWIAFLQLPFAVHQYLVLVPRRQGMGEGVVPVDIVAGTFGGSVTGGGANAVLAAFLMIVIACLLGLWKHRTLSGMKLVITLPILLSPLLVNEAKITAIYLPLVFALLFYRDLIARPLRFIGAGGAMLALLAVVMTALTLAHPSGRLTSWTELVELTLERQTATVSERRGQFSELSRWTALTFWADQHRTENPVYTVIGHGLGASRVQESGLLLADTLAETRYGGLQLGYTAFSALLWDTGIAGLACILAMMWAAFRTAGRLSDHYRGRDGFKAGLFDGLRAGIAVITVSLAHKDFFVFNLPYQTLVMLILGYLVVSSARLADDRTAARLDE